MPSIILKNYAQPQALADSNNRINPLSYQEWLSNNVGIIPNQAEFQYNSYLRSFYTNKQNDLNQSTNKLREDYIALLKRLQVIFKDDEDFDRITKIDFNSEADIRLAIPYFARKLKEIALFYVSKRETLKKTKLKYNLVGSTDGVEKVLYEYLLEAFTKKDHTITVQDKNLFNNIPALSSINNLFSIKVEELFDMTNYFDREYSEQNNATGVYNLSSNNPLLFVLEDYIFNLYNAFDVTEVPLSSLSNPLAQFVLCETGDEINEQILATLDSKYIGNDLYYLTGGYFDYNRRNVSLDLAQGNNFFYWFSGEYVREIPEGIFQSISLSSLNWDLATGSTNLSSSDIVFISVGNHIEGAWLVDANQILVNATMSATMRDGKQFKFPYPSIGLSSENVEWSGPKIEDLSEYNKEFFPNEQSFADNQERIKDRYWSEFDSISSVNSLYLQDTHLSESGAYAGNSFQNADKIIVRRDVAEDRVHDATPDEVFNGTLETAWLYNFSQTEIPVGKGDTSIYYPLSSYTDINQLFFKYSSGIDIPLSSLDVGSSFAGAIAGTTIDLADMLIKLDSSCGGVKEAAWLSGIPLSAFTADNIDRCNCNGDYSSFYTNWKYSKGAIQSSLAFKNIPGQFQRFVWTGPKTNLDDIKGFAGFDHDSSCPYYQNRNYFSLINNNFLDRSKKGQFEKWKTCTCKAVNYSPLGHSGDSIGSYKFLPDIIVKDSQFPNPFGFNKWTGYDGLDYKSSDDVAWFKAENLLEPDFGWGKGSWVKHDGNSFYLEPGQSYIHYRSDLNRCNFELPFFVINEGYCECVIGKCVETECLPVWKKAIQDDDGNWLDAGTISDMMMQSDSFYTYSHKPSFNFSKTIFTYEGNVVNSISGDYVTLSATDPNIGEVVSDISIPSVNFLMKIPLSGNKPYWGVASFEEDKNTSSKMKMVGVEDFRVELDYLQVKQPYPSQILLSDKDTLEYKTSDCNDCFVWTEPLVFNVQEKLRRWNKILVDSCVRSELLNYLHGLQCNPCDISTHRCLSECQEQTICGCENLCYPTKVGLSATSIPSDLIFNTELSGIPVFVDYFARTPFTLDFTVIDISNGIPPTGGLWVPPVSTLFLKAELPWNNIINDFYPTVASVQNDSLSSQPELGLFTPNRLFNSKYELRKAVFDIDYLERNANSSDIVRKETYADGDINVESVDSEWMKWKGNNRFSGNVKVDGKQVYYPYTSNYEMFKFNNVGLYDNNDSQFTPWNSDGTWKDENTYPANFRGQHRITCGDNAWFNNQLNLSGNVVEWQNDIFGNQYFLLNRTGNRIKKSQRYSDFYLKDVAGKIVPAAQSLSAIFTKYQNLTS